MFKIEKIKFLEGGVSREINFSDSKDVQTTILIGKNGSGKSSLLRSIATIFKGGVIRRRSDYTEKITITEISYSCNGELENRVVRDSSIKKKTAPKEYLEEKIAIQKYTNPSSVVSLSYTSFDKFPREKLWGFEEDSGALAKYTYIGPLDGMGRSSSFNMLYKAIDLLSDSYFNENYHREPIMETFGLLGLYPAITVSYLLYDRDFIANIFAVSREFSDKTESNVIIENLLKDAHLQKWARAYRGAASKSLDKITSPETVLGRRLLSAVSFARSIEYSQFEKEKIIDFEFNFQQDDFNHNVTEDYYNLLVVLRQLRACQLHSAKVRKIENDSEWYDVREASSGELNFISSMLGLSAALKPGGLVLIDEPENSLHPEWQRQYVKILSSVMKSKPGSFCVIATHSPIIVPQLTLNSQSGVAMIGMGDSENCYAEDFIEDSADAVLLQQFGYASDDNYLIKTAIAEAIEAGTRRISSPEIFTKKIAKLRSLNIPSSHQYSEIVKILTEGGWDGLSN